MVKKPNVRQEIFPVITEYIESLKIQKELAKKIYNSIDQNIKQQERYLAKLHKRYDKQ